MPDNDLDLYQQNALRTWKLHPDDRAAGALNAALGLTGEAGEVADLVKKWLYPSKEGDGLTFGTEAANELGDVLYYVAVFARVVLDMPLSEIARINADKLKKRHAHYLAQKGIAHAD